MPVTLIRLIAIAGVIIAGLLIAIAHRQRPELPALATPLSIYFTHPTRALMFIAYAAIAVALVCTAVALAVEMHVLVVWTVFACSVGALLLAPVAATTQHSAAVIRSEATKRAHRYTAIAAFLAVGVAMGASSYDAIVRTHLPIAMVGFLGAVLVGVVLWSKPGSVYGLKQKLLLGVLGMWILTVAGT